MSDYSENCSCHFLNSVELKKRSRTKSYDTIPLVYFRYGTVQQHSVLTRRHAFIPRFDQNSGLNRMAHYRFLYLVFQVLEVQQYSLDVLHNYG